MRFGDIWKGAAYSIGREYSTGTLLRSRSEAAVNAEKQALMPVHSVDAGAWRVCMQLLRKRMEVEEI